MHAATTRKVYIRKLQKLDGQAPASPSVQVESTVDDDDDIIEVKPKASPQKSPPTNIARPMTAQPMTAQPMTARPMTARPMTARPRPPLHSGSASALMHSSVVTSNAYYKSDPFHFSVHV